MEGLSFNCRQKARIDQSSEMISFGLNENVYRNTFQASESIRFYRELSGQQKSVRDGN